MIAEETSATWDMYAPGALEHAGVVDTPSVKWAHATIGRNVADYLSK